MPLIACSLLPADLPPPPNTFHPSLLPPSSFKHPALMSAGNYAPLNTSEPPNDGAPLSWRGRSSFASTVPDGWLNIHSLKKSKPVVIALGVITLVTVFVGTQFTIGEGGFDFRSAGKGEVVPEDVLVHHGLEGNGFSKKWGNVSDVSQFLVGPPANSIRGGFGLCDFEALKLVGG